MGDDKFLPSLHTVLLLVRESTFYKLPHLALLASHSLSWRMCGSCCPAFCREAQYSCWILSPWTRLLSILCSRVVPQQEKKKNSKISQEEWSNVLVILLVFSSARMFCYSGAEGHCMTQTPGRDAWVSRLLFKAAR